MTRPPRHAPCEGRSASVIPHSACRIQHFHPAFATSYALILMTLLSLAVLSLSALFAAQLRRTRAAPVEAQARQILLAATTAIQDALNHNRPIPAELPLPAALAPARCTLRTLPYTDPGPRRIHVEARVSDSILTQILTFQPPAATATSPSRTRPPGS